jgi:hypothetical protein
MTGCGPYRSLFLFHPEKVPGKNPYRWRKAMSFLGDPIKKRKTSFLHYPSIHFFSLLWQEKRMICRVSPSS